MKWPRLTSKPSHAKKENKFFLHEIGNLGQVNEQESYKTLTFELYLSYYIMEKNN